MVKLEAICFRCTADVNRVKGVTKYMMLPREQWTSSRPQYVVQEKLVTKRKRNGESSTRRPRKVNPEWGAVLREFETDVDGKLDAAGKRVYTGSCEAKLSDGSVCGTRLRSYGRPEGVSPLPKRVKEVKQAEKQSEEDAKKN